MTNNGNSKWKDFEGGEAILPHPSNSETSALSQRVLQAQRMRPALLAEGRRRQGIVGAEGKNSAPKHDTRAILARHCGLAPRTFDKALAVIEAAQNDPERYAGVIEQLDRTGNVDRAYSAVVFALDRRDRSQAPLFRETIIGKRRLGDLTARELAWLIGFFLELGKHFDRRTSGYACDVFTEAQVRRAIKRAQAMESCHQNSFAKRAGQRRAV